MGKRIFSEQEIEDIIMSNAEQTEKALISLNRFQTADEKLHGTSSHSNKVGFNAADAFFCTSMVRWLLSKTDRHLTEKQLTTTRKILKKYVKQLTKIANGQQ